MLTSASLTSVFESVATDHDVVSMTANRYVNSWAPPHPGSSARAVPRQEARALVRFTAAGSFSPQLVHFTAEP